MKKVLLILCFVMLLSLSACKDKDDKKNSKNETVDVTEDEKTPAVITFKDNNGNVIISNDDIESVKFEKNPEPYDNPYLVEIIFTDEGSKKLAEATKELQGQNISVYLDDKIVLTSKFEQEITDGKMVISGLTYEEATEIADGFNGN